jgi:uncharacterized protein (TIGR03083 family)
MSHLGSGAEIFGLFLEAGLKGQDPPGREVFSPIWDAWNARTPSEQAAEALRVDGALVERFESIDPADQDSVRLSMFGMDLDLTGLLRMRLGEHALHTWDVAVARDDAATVADDAVELLVDTIAPLVARTGKPSGTPVRVAILTTAPDRHFSLEVDETVTLADTPDGEDLPQVRLPAEALIRLVYGRLDPSHTPPVESQGVDLDELRRLFPGF